MSIQTNDKSNIIVATIQLTMNKINPSKTVYLRSIPYDQTEQQILDLCSSVGPVVDLRVMFDQHTGRSKGYAFVEYPDLATSASAVRNLNGLALGSRHLRCGYSTESTSAAAAADTSDNNNGTNNNNINNNNTNFFPENLDLPLGVDVNINLTTPAMMVSSELSRIPVPDQLLLLRTLQEWSQREPVAAEKLLEDCPQLNFAVAELLLSNNLCRTEDLLPLALQQESKVPEETIDAAAEEKQRALLRQVMQLNDADLGILPEDERMAVWDIKQRGMRGEFGPI